MPFITTKDGTQIFYKDWGSKDAQPIVFSHGWPLSSDDWDTHMMFLLGKQAMFGHEPPMYLRSTTATRCPCVANVQAATVPPVPPPKITRSYSLSSALALTFIFYSTLIAFLQMSATIGRG